MHLYMETNFVSKESAHEFVVIARNNRDSGVLYELLPAPCTVVSYKSSTYIIIGNWIPLDTRHKRFK